MIATPTLRAALQCNDPKLKSYQGNRFVYSKSKVTGLNEPAFDISGTRGTVFGMQLGRYAGYSLSFHHSGAPRCWTVVTPIQHDRLESFMLLKTCREEDSQDEIGRPRKPPACSDFMAHQQIYVPDATLKSEGLESIKVVQHEGEMVVIFPWAYHQAFNAGPNIIESMMYASTRWEVFLKEKLYQRCNRNCAAAQEDTFDFEFLANSLSIGRLRSGLHRRLSSQESLLKEELEQGRPSADLERNPDDTCGSSGRSKLSDELDIREWDDSGDESDDESDDESNDESNDEEIPPSALRRSSRLNSSHNERNEPSPNVRRSKRLIDHHINLSQVEEQSGYVWDPEYGRDYDPYNRERKRKKFKIFTAPTDSGEEDWTPQSSAESTNSTSKTGSPDV